MFTVKTKSENELQVDFRHTDFQEDGSRWTYCTFRYVNKITDHPVVLTRGAARCSPEDNFNRNKGRKIAMTRALKSLPLNKDARRVVWNKYFRTRGKID